MPLPIHFQIFASNFSQVEKKSLLIFCHQIITHFCFLLSIPVVLSISLCRSINQKTLIFVICGTFSSDIYFLNIETTYLHHPPCSFLKLTIHFSSVLTQLEIADLPLGCNFCFAFYSEFSCVQLGDVLFLKTSK